MSKGAINFSNDNEYYTPKNIIDYFGSFDYDPATTKEKAKEFNISNFDTIETNGLIREWGNFNKIWINPPFTEKVKFLEKAINTYNNDKLKEIYILLPINFITTITFYNLFLYNNFKLYIPKGRIKFENKNKEVKAPAFGSIIIKLQEVNELEIIDFKEK